MNFSGVSLFFRISKTNLEAKCRSRSRFSPPIDLIHDVRHLCTRLRTDGIKAMSRGLSGKQVINFSNTKTRGRVCLFLTTENEKLFILKTIMANYGWKLSWWKQVIMTLILPKLHDH